LGNSRRSPFGITPDISALLLFTFYQKNYYLDAEIPFPNSKEKARRFVGIAENVGDAMTFSILTEDTNKLIARSVLRSAEDPTTANKRIDSTKPEEETPQIVKSIQDMSKGISLPSFNPEELLGRYSLLNMLVSSRKQR
jgi:hypothetical protein